MILIYLLAALGTAIKAEEEGLPLPTCFIAGAIWPAVLVYSILNLGEKDVD